ncbi:MAG: GNAT family N-acetyltransferase [Planctomycetota bacterium]
MDQLARPQTKAVGWMPTKQFEGKVAAGHVLIAEDLAGQRIGYLIATDRYLKRDELGVVFQMNVAPDRQRGLVAATLLKAQFERSAYGCRLYCCWCAQDLPANRFWEAMGFVPLAYRVGSMTKGKGRSGGGPRVHIFWQKRIVEGDNYTPWWFPAKTEGGALQADRVVLPIPPGKHWSEPMPLVLPGGESLEPKALPGPTRTKAVRREKVAKTVPMEQPANGLQFAIPKPQTAATPAEDTGPAEIEAKPKRSKPRADPKLVAAARELRDRFLEEANLPEHAHLLTGSPKYHVGRSLCSTVPSLTTEEPKRLAA